MNEYLHGPSFASSGLPIRKDSPIEPPDYCPHNWQCDLLVYLVLMGIRAKDSIECKAVFILIHLSLFIYTFIVMSFDEYYTHS